MDKNEFLEKPEMDEGITVEEIVEYQKNVKYKEHVYGKYGTLAKLYIERQCVGKMWSLADNLPAYLHNIDEQAEKLYSVMYNKLSKDEKYKRTGNYLEDVRRIKEMQDLIEEEILNEIVYV